jgi:hypothetical protein
MIKIEVSDPKEGQLTTSPMMSCRAARNMPSIRAERMIRIQWRSAWTSASAIVGAAVARGPGPE